MEGDVRERAWSSESLNRLKRLKRLTLTGPGLGLRSEAKREQTELSSSAVPHGTGRISELHCTLL